MNALKFNALKTIVQIAYEIAIGKRGEVDTKDDITGDTIPFKEKNLPQEK